MSSSSAGNKGDTPALAVFEKPAYLADIRTDPIRYPHYRTGAREQRQRWLAGQITALASLLRIKDYTKADAIGAATSLDGQIMGHQFISDYTLVEISEAFRRGLYGEYGEWHGLTVQSLWGFLTRSLNSPVRQEAVNMIYAKKQAEAEERERRKIQEDIAKAKASGEFTPTGKLPAVVRKVYASTEEDIAHREKVRQQAREILARAGANTPNNNNEITW